MSGNLNTRCEKCGAPIHFLRHRSTGRFSPIEVAPVAGGNIAVDLDRRECWSIKAAERAGRTDLHLNHFATCKYREEFRKT